MVTIALKLYKREKKQEKAENEKRVMLAVLDAGLSVSNEYITIIVTSLFLIGETTKQK